MLTPPLVIEDVDKTYGSSGTVLRGLSLRVEPGDAMALVGVNGAGKTTLIKAVLDFISIDGGSIRINDCPHRDYRARKTLAYLPERFQPPYYVTGSGFLDMMARLYEVPLSGTEIADYARALDLPNEVLERPVRTYSKGMAQKLGLIAALASQRSLLLLDEPMSGLDPRARHSFKKLLRALGEQGRTLFYSTHLLADVGSICNRMAILHDGVICFQGTPDRCRELYAADDLEAAYMTCIEGSAVAAS